MDSIVVSDSETIVVGTEIAGVVVVDNQSASTIVTGLIGPPGATSLAEMVDIDKTQLVNGATLVYDSSAAVWRATNKLDNQIFEAGQF